MSRKQSPIDQLTARLESDYMTVDEAHAYVREQRPELRFTKRQIYRAIADGNLDAESVGRVRYIPREQVEAYEQQLMESRAQPGKARLRPNSMR